MSDVKLKTFNSGTFGKYYNLIIEVWQKAQSEVNNTSDIYAVGYVDVGSGWINASASRAWSGTVGGQAVSGSYAFGNIQSGTKKLFTTPVKTIKHNTDGSKNITVSMTIAVNLTLGGTKITNVTASSSVTLTNIARNSKITSVTKTLAVNGTNKCVVELEAAAVSSYTNKVTYSIGTHTHTETLTASQTKSEYAIPETWKDSFPNAKSGNMTVTLKTYSGTNQVGTTDTGTCVLNCTGTEIPSFNIVVSDPTGTKGKIGCYVAGMSKIKAAVENVTFVYGAKVKSIDYTINGVKYTGTKTNVTGASYVPKGTQTVKVTVTDTRGYTRTLTESITAYVYESPRISASVSRYRKDGSEYVKDDEGGYAQIWYRVSVSEIGTNHVSEVVISYKQQGGTETGDVSLSKDEHTAYILADTEKVYNITITAKDVLTEKVINKTLSTALTIFDILKGGIGFALGGVASLKKNLDIFWNTNIRGTLKVEKPIFSNYTNPISGSYSVSTGSEWIEVCEIPQLEDGAYHFDVVATFPANATGNRGLSMSYSDDDGNTKTYIFNGWTDVRPGIGGWSTHCRLTANTTIVGRKLYLRVFQTSGNTMDVDIRISYHRIN